MGWSDPGCDGVTRCLSLPSGPVSGIEHGQSYRAPKLRLPHQWAVIEDQVRVDFLCQIWHINALTASRKPLFWIGSSLADLRLFPVDVKEELGYALHIAQTGAKHPRARPLRGFGGAGTLEVTSDHGGNAFRAVYTVRFPAAVYVLHAFQKKSRRGIKTPMKHLKRVRTRLKLAEEHYATWSRRHGKETG